MATTFYVGQTLSATVTYRKADGVPEDVQVATFWTRSPNGETIEYPPDSMAISHLGAGVYKLVFVPDWQGRWLILARGERTGSVILARSYVDVDEAGI